MAGNIQKARGSAGAILKGVQRMIAKGSGKTDQPARDVYSEMEIEFYAGKCGELATTMRTLPDDPMGDSRMIVGNLQQYQQMLKKAAKMIGDGYNAHQVSYQMSDRLGVLRVVLESLDRIETGKSAKAAAVVAAAKAVGTPRVKAVDVNALIRRAKTLSNGVHGAVNVGQGLRNVPADKHYSAGQMKAFAAQCARIAEAVMELPDNGSGNRAEANRVFASAGVAFYDLADSITGSAHQFSFQIADSPDKLIVIGIKVLERMAAGKA